MVEELVDDDTVAVVEAVRGVGKESIEAEWLALGLFLAQQLFEPGLFSVGAPVVDEGVEAE